MVSKNAKVLVRHIVTYNRQGSVSLERIKNKRLEVLDNVSVELTDQSDLLVRTTSGDVWKVERCNDQQYQYRTID